jgi:hypothetical protein
VRDQRFFAYTAAVVALGALVGGFALAAAPSSMHVPPAPSSSVIQLSVDPGTATTPAAYSSLHVMVRHGPVTITLVNHDTASHGLDVPSLGIYLDVPGGSTVTYSTTITATGLHDWYCWHPCPGDASPLLSGAGMSGDLVVV